METPSLNAETGSAIPKQLTFGEYRVGISFNPGGHPKVNEIKQKAAELIDLLEAEKATMKNGEAVRCIALAQTEIESAAMWAVKAVTKPDR